MKNEKGSPLIHKSRPSQAANKKGWERSSDQIKQGPNTNTPDWQLVQSKKDKKKQRQQHLSGQTDQRPKKQRPRRSPTGSNALIVRPKEKAMYAEILTRIKKSVPDEQVCNTVDKIRKTAGGDLLIILTKQNTDGGKALQQAMVDLLKDDADVISKGPQEDLEIRDLDDTTTKEDIRAALQKVAGADLQIPEDAVKSVRNAYGGTKTAVVTLAAAIAKVALGEHGMIRIGWVNCRIRPIERPTKCFKCWHYGHTAIQCKSAVDRSKHCYKCGEEGHKAVDCTKTARCVLCIEHDNTENTAHFAGSSRCRIYQTALQKIQGKRKSKSRSSN